MNIKPYIPKPRLMLLFSILIALSIVIITPTTKVYATEGNGTGNDGNKAGGGYAGGPS